MKRSFRRNVPADGDWAAVTERAAGIYGANASGKTTVLLCLSLLQVAVKESLRLCAIPPPPVTFMTPTRFTETTPRRSSWSTSRKTFGIGGRSTSRAPV
ncbi:hypothetical protein V5S96_09480 [Corynebacterium mastitidis]|uniref:AAA domain-containing protein n=1 Tax=Corynebacterium mastitidis TaxID=161890 RepID=A0ABU8P2S3_9CORY